MSKEEIMLKILTAPPDTLAKVAGLLEGRVPEAAPGDRRLLTFTDAARHLNVSRMTVHRMVADGRLPVVETRLGRRWVASQALTDFLKRGACA